MTVPCSAPCVGCYGVRDKLESARIVSLVRERVAAGVPEHVRMRLEAQLGHRACAFDHASEASRREWRAALRREHERRLGILFTLKPPQGTQFVPHNRMSAGSALLDPTNVQGACFEVHLLPAQVHQFRRSKAMPVRHEDTRSSICLSLPVKCGDTLLKSAVGDLEHRAVAVRPAELCRAKEVAVGVGDQGTVGAVEADQGRQSWRGRVSATAIDEIEGIFTGRLVRPDESIIEIRNLLTSSRGDSTN